jgi:hypothetical protein
VNSFRDLVLAHYRQQFIAKTQAQAASVGDIVENSVQQGLGVMAGLLQPFRPVSADDHERAAV